MNLNMDLKQNKPTIQLGLVLGWLMIVCSVLQGVYLIVAYHTIKEDEALLYTLQQEKPVQRMDYKEIEALPTYKHTLYSTQYIVRYLEPYASAIKGIEEGVWQSWQPGEKYGVGIVPYKLVFEGEQAMLDACIVHLGLEPTLALNGVTVTKVEKGVRATIDIACYMVLEE